VADLAPRTDAAGTAVRSLDATNRAGLATGGANAPAEDVAPGGGTDRWGLG
jgi:hypothetical protein